LKWGRKTAWFAFALAFMRWMFALTRLVSTSKVGWEMAEICIDIGFKTQKYNISAQS
jgi:hypothetical protein